jgi:UDP-N-acetyl-D-mannosaminuronate dehydrogenase
MIIKKDVQHASCKPCTTPFRGKKLLLGWALKKDTNDTRESAVYVADDLINEEAQIAVLIRK